jgi:Adenylylsulphate kinase
MMAKANSNGNETGYTNQPTVHFILQGKGGIGKSVVASWLAEFLIERGLPVRCIDGDPVNRSLSQHKAFSVEKLDLVNQDGILQRTRYDSIIERFATDDAVFVVDNGATVFLPLWTYIVETDMFSVLRQAGRHVYVHVPISGGEMLNDTLLGFKTLAESAPERNLILWINEYFGPVARDGKAFNEMQVYLDNQDKVLASVGIPRRSSDTYGETVRTMREKKLTFAEAIASPEFMLVQKSRLHIVRRELFEQLEKTPFA